jgi:hypothetical protein
MWRFNRAKWAFFSANGAWLVFWFKSKVGFLHDNFLEKFGILLLVCVSLRVKTNNSTIDRKPKL